MAKNECFCCCFKNPSAQVVARHTRPVASSQQSVADELTKLKGLLDAGLLTQREFDAQKQKLLM
jgi:hypothetical protein